MPLIYVIDDDADITALLKRFLSKNGYEVEVATSGKEGLAKLEARKPDLVMSDFRLGDYDGADLLVRMKEMYADVPVIIITGYSDVKIAVKVLRLGAFDYVTKPLLPEEILLTIKKALQSGNTPQHNEPALTDSTSTATEKKQLASNATYKKGNTNYLFGKSDASQNLLRQIELVAPTNYSIIIYGESGAGKEGVARTIHDRSKRSSKPFVAMDCGAISKELANSELFGHEKGSFTGALAQKIGHFEMANGGTLFLDEVSNLPYDVQVALLRVVQERKVKRIGSTKEIDIDVRIIVASNERLSEAYKKGKFREDLYHRFNEFGIELPPLRERGEDIINFAHFFLEQTIADLGKHITSIEPEAQKIFLNYSWPGNLRELKNVIKRAALLSEGNAIQARALPFELVNQSKLFFEDSVSDASIQHTNRQYQEPAPVSGLNNYSNGNTANVSSTKEPLNLKKAALEAEYETILNALKQANFNKSKAAQILGIDRKTLYNKMKLINPEKE
jgi:two-component system response regulator HydG